MHCPLKRRSITFACCLGYSRGHKTMYTTIFCYDAYNTPSSNNRPNNSNRYQCRFSFAVGDCILRRSAKLLFTPSSIRRYWTRFKLKTSMNKCINVLTTLNHPDRTMSPRLIVEMGFVCRKRIRDINRTHNGAIFLTPDLHNNDVAFFPLSDFDGDTAVRRAQIIGSSDILATKIFCY